jgi:hypothetical protein
VSILNEKSTLSRQSLKDQWKNDIQTIRRLLVQEQKLIFFNISVPPSLFNNFIEFKDTMHTLITLLQDNSLSPECLGVHLSMKDLISTDPKLLNQMMHFLVDYRKENPKFSVISMATNYLTLETTSPIIKDLKKEGFHLVGTDALALNATKAGQISTEYGYMPTHLLKERERDFTNRKDHIQLAVKDFTEALDRCISVEDASMKRTEDRELFKRNETAVEDLFVGYAVRSHISNFWFPEEWNLFNAFYVSDDWIILSIGG